MTRRITPQTTIENLKKEAKRRLKEVRARGETALALREMQHRIAVEFGMTGWTELIAALGKQNVPDYARLAQDFVDAYEGNAEALARLNEYYGRSFTQEDHRAEMWRRVYAFRQRAWRSEKNFLKLEEAQIVLAQDAGFGNWAALMAAAVSGAPPVDAFGIDEKENRIGPRRRLSDTEWDGLIGAAREQRVTHLDGNGLMTDGVLARVAELEHITHLSLGGSRELTDDGLLQLARMPQLESLGLSEYPGGKLTDRGLEVLRHLPNLRRFEMTWQAGISDAGVANLKYCDRLEQVDLMGSPTGDAAIEALQGKPHLTFFHSGRLVTDAGLPFLRHFPALSNLLIDGPFTGEGLASLEGLEAITELDLFWHVTELTAAAFAHLATWPNLQALGCDGKLADDVALGHIGGMARLRKLRAQEAAAGDDGFEALARSQSLEGFWGRQCPGFGSRAFRAFAKMPALARLGVSLNEVADDALALLPDFPALRELTPVGLKDDGFRHIGKCQELERLVCMYCRETTDSATEHIAGLALKSYYAGLTQITDRSLEILGRMASLEKIELYECMKITDAGVAGLAALPNLREVSLDGSPGVTLAGTRVFGPQVRVNYST